LFLLGVLLYLSYDLNYIYTHLWHKCLYCWHNAIVQLCLLIWQCRFLILIIRKIHVYIYKPLETIRVTSTVYVRYPWKRLLITEIKYLLNLLSAFVLFLFPFQGDKWSTNGNNSKYGLWCRSFHDCSFVIEIPITRCNYQHNIKQSSHANSTYKSVEHLQ